jgi:hypothetical protein
MQRVPLAGRSPVLFCVLVALWFALPTRASAEELTSRGNLVFSADRLFGLYFAHESIEVTSNTSVETDRSSIGFGWSVPAGNSLLTIPRLGVDYFLTHGFTLGGNIGIWSGNFNDDDDDRSLTAFLVAARVGYALRLSHVVSLWPRGGFTYSTLSYEGSEADFYTFALTVEAPFVFAITEGFAFTAGPNLDLGFLGERASRDASETVFGLMVGLSGWTNL